MILRGNLAQFLQYQVTWTRAVHGGRLVWVCNHPAGTVNLLPSGDGLPKSALLCDLKIKEDWRRQGYGTKLVRAAAERGQEIGLKTLTVVAAAEEFWQSQQKFGWKEYEKATSVGGLVGSPPDFSGDWLILELDNHRY